MSETNPQLQTGRRRQLIDEISKLTDTEEQKLRGKELSSPQIKKIYTQVTENTPNWEENKAWHIRQILDELEIEERKTIASGTGQLSVKSLKAVRDYLRQ